jgi:hypothetical protein
MLGILGVYYYTIPARSQGEEIEWVKGILKEKND